MRYKVTLPFFLFSFLVITLVACERAPDPNKYPITPDKVVQDLSGKAVVKLGDESIPVEGPMLTNNFSVTYDGKTGAAHLFLKTVNPTLKQGIDGEVTAHYKFEKGTWNLQSLSAEPAAKMHAAYAQRLTELVDFPLHFAANFGDETGVVEVLAEGVDVNATEAKRDSTAVMFASERGFLPIVKLLTEKGADLSHANKLGYTALHAATRGRHLEVVKYLLANGAAANIKDGRGRTPFFTAAESGSLELVRLLKEHGADLEEKDIKLWTPLYAAVNSGSVEITKYLIEQGARVKNEADKSSRSPLLAASFSGNAEMVQLLIDAGADVNAKLSVGHRPYRDMSALQLAQKEGHEEVVEILKKAGAE